VKKLRETFEHRMFKRTGETDGQCSTVHHSTVEGAYLKLRARAQIALSEVQVQRLRENHRCLISKTELYSHRRSGAP